MGGNLAQAASGTPSLGVYRGQIMQGHNILDSIYSLLLFASVLSVLTILVDVSTKASVINRVLVKAVILIFNRDVNNA